MPVALKDLLAKRVQALKLVNEDARLLKPKESEVKKDESKMVSNNASTGTSNVNT